jgi:hypothetical protein
VNDNPIDLDKHRGMAAQKATDIRRALAEMEVNAASLRERQRAVEAEMVAVQAAGWPEAVAKARYVLNLYAAGLPPADSHHRDLVKAVIADMTRLCSEG